MSYQDKKLKCRDCGGEFTFTSGEQEFFAQKGFEAPSRCPDCRKKKKSLHKKREPTVETHPSQIYEIICSSCAKKVDVPFKPRNPEGVLCAQCFEKNKNKY